MSESLDSAIAMYAAGLAGWAALSAARGAGPTRGQFAGVVVLELALLAQALTALVAGDHAEEPATFLGYLAASVLILPVTVPAARAGTRWDAGVLAVASLALAVVCLRLRATRG